MSTKGGILRGDKIALYFVVCGPQLKCLGHKYLEPQGTGMSNYSYEQPLFVHIQPLNAFLLPDSSKLSVVIRAQSYMYTV